MNENNKKKNFDFPNQENKRNQKRQTLELLISYTVGEQVFSNFSFDLSSTGLFIETRSPLKVGEKLTVLFELPHNKIKFTIPSKVMWVRVQKDQSNRPLGMGLKFEKHDKESELETAIQFFEKLENQ